MDHEQNDIELDDVELDAPAVEEKPKRDKRDLSGKALTEWWKETHDVIARTPRASTAESRRAQLRAELDRAGRELGPDRGVGLADIGNDPAAAARHDAVHAAVRTLEATMPTYTVEVIGAPDEIVQPPPVRIVHGATKKTRPVAYHPSEHGPIRIWRGAKVLTHVTSSAAEPSDPGKGRDGLWPAGDGVLRNEASHWHFSAIGGAEARGRRTYLADGTAKWLSREELTARGECLAYESRGIAQGGDDGSR